MRLEIRQTGFTLIELLVVIAVIGILASVVLASLNSARTKGADAKIKSELKQIATALELYYDKHGTYVVAGGGNGGNGWGWVGLEGEVAQTSRYTKAISTVLAEEGFLGTGISSANYSDRKYMLYNCNGGQRYALSATLKNPTAQDIAHIQTTCKSEESHGLYGKNYAIGN